MRPRIVLTGAFALASLLVATAHAADLPNDVVTAQDASPFKAAIEKYVREQVQFVQKHDESSGKAREELCKQAESTPNKQVSASFQLIYTDALVASLSPLQARNAPIEDRLNAAIIIARNANATRSLNMQSAVVTLLDDESPAVALWGVKAAGALLPSVLQGGFNANNEKLTSGIVGAVKNHPTSGPIVQDAYRALDLSSAKPPLPALGLNKATDAINAILAERVSQYVVSVPTDPQVDRDPANYLWRDAVLAAAAPKPGAASKQRDEAVQNLVNLLSVSGSRFFEAKIAADRTNLQGVTEAAAGAMQNIMTSLGNKDAAATFRPMLKVGQLSPAQFQQNLQAAIVAVRQMPDFSKLQDPPKSKPMDRTAAGN